MSAAATTEPDVLRYQHQRRLDEVPGYLAGLQLRVPGHGRVYLARSATELAVYFEQQLALHYDLEGRLGKISQPGLYRRRGLSHRVLLTRKTAAGIERTVLSEEQADETVRFAHEMLLPVQEALGKADIDTAKPDPATALEQIAPLLARAAQFDVRRARQDAATFRSIYGRIAVLPPDQYNALVLQATEGCAYAGCLFCELYRGVPYRQKTPAEFCQHLRAAVAYHGEALRARRSIFLGEANALAVSQERLLEFFDILRAQFEFPPPGQQQVPASWWLGSKTRFDGVSSFMDAFTTPLRTASQYRQLHRAGLRRVYIGLESGDAGLLRWLRKPATPEAVLRCVRLLKQAEIFVGVIVLLGAGGRERAGSHVRETAAVLNELPLGRGDFIYFSPLVIRPGGRYAGQAGACGVEPLSGEEMLAQERAIRAALRWSAGRGRPYMARYELELFVY
jgi:hypothetical protein